MLEDIKNIKSGKKELREFGITIGIVFIVLGGIALWRGKAAYPYLIVFGIVFAALGASLPSILKPLQKIWMAIVVIIGFFMSRIILGILFYLVITPIGMIMKISGKDILDERIEKSRSSYWVAIKGSPKTKESYENQF